VLFTILAGGVDRTQIGLLDLRTGQYKVLVKEGSQPVYLEPGYVVFRVANTLRAVRFDRERGEVSGEPVTVVENVAASNTGSVNSDIARNGTLVYLAGTVQGQDRTFVWVDRSGKLAPVTQPARPYVYPRIARDGARLAVDVRDAEQDIWIADVRRGTMTRLSFGPSLDAYPVWMPDGRTLLYASSRDGAQAIFRQAADGTGAPQRVAAGPEGEGLPVSVSPDGQYALVRIRGRLKALSLNGGMSIDMRSLGDAGQLNGDISPDGRWLAFDSTESGRSEVYVRPFPRLNDGRWQVSTTGGSKPVWGPGGKELFYEDQAAWIIAAPVESGSSFSSGVPHRLFEARNMVIGTTTIRSWDVAPDGRFLMIQDSSVNDPNAGPPIMTVVLNWVEELKTKLPAQPR
jgi:hypothetical protein